MEITENIIVCVNLMDEAKRKKIDIDLKSLSQQLGVPVIGITARSKKSLNELLKSIDKKFNSNTNEAHLKISYTKPVEEAIDILEPVLKQIIKKKINSRWLALKLLDYDKALIEELDSYNFV